MRPPAEFIKKDVVIEEAFISARRSTDENNMNWIIGSSHKIGKQYD